MLLEQFQKDDLLVVCPNAIKMRLLKSQSVIQKIKYMTLEEFKRHYFYSYDYQSYDYLMNQYGYSLDFCKTILENLYSISIDQCYHHSKLQLLSKIKKELIENHLLFFDPLFSSFLEKKKKIVLGYSTLEKYEEEMFSSFTIIEEDEGDFSPCVYECESLEDEIIFICEEILQLSKKGVPLSKIYIGNVSSDYLYTIYTIFSSYKIPCNLSMRQSLYATPIVQEYLRSKKLPGFMNSITQQLISCIHKLTFVEDSPNYSIFLTDLLKNTMVQEEKYQDAVTVMSDVFDVAEDEYLFLVQFAQDVLPRVYKDEDYISDSIKDEISYFTTKEKNVREKQVLYRRLSRLKHCYLSYCKNSNFSSYLPSSFLSDFSFSTIPYQRKITHSHLLNQIFLGQYLDSYYKYGEVDPLLYPLFHHYPISYLSYENQFTGIKKSDYYQWIQSFLRLSYTSMNSYFLCPFQYYVRYVLKIDPFLKSFYTEIGNLFHYFFSIMDYDTFSFEREWERYLSSHEFSIKEQFFLKELKEQLREDISLIQEQDLLTSFQKKYYEKEITIPLEKEISCVFTGKIDKVLFEEEMGEVHLSIIDYKTGALSLNLPLMKHGLHMQLAVYLYLIEHSSFFSKVRYAGIYLQKVLFSKYSYDSSKTVKEQRESDLRLQGYSNSDVSLLSRFDKSYENSKFIRGMKLKKDGTFFSTSKVLDDSEISAIIQYTGKKIDEATSLILEGNFKVAPKVVDQANLACKNCHYQDLCFRKHQDFIYCDSVSDFSFLGDDKNGE